jgi:transcriptional regulatory protein LevR
VGQAIVLTVGADTATVIADQVRDALSSGDWIALQVPATRR